MGNKKLLILLIFTAIFYACDKDTEEFNSDVEALENLTESNATLSKTTTINIGDVNMRGWDCDGSTISFVTYDEKSNETTLHIGTTDDCENFNETKTMFLGNDDIVRSWSWDGTRASYHVFRQGRTDLIYRNFDGTTLDKKTLESVKGFTTADNIIGWDWNGVKASYLALNPIDGKVYRYDREINANARLSDDYDRDVLEDNNVATWSINPSNAGISYYHTRDNNNTVLNITASAEDEGGIDEVAIGPLPVIERTSLAPGTQYATVQGRFKQPTIVGINEGHRIQYIISIRQESSEGVLLGVASIINTIVSDVGDESIVFQERIGRGAIRDVEYKYNYIVRVLDQNGNTITSRSELRKDIDFDEISPIRVIN